MSGATTSTGLPSRTDPEMCARSTGPNGKPAPPTDQYSPSNPYADDHTAAA
jgi:hypothetical protein